MKKILAVVLVLAVFGIGIIIGLKTSRQIKLNKGPKLSLLILEPEMGSGLILRTPENKAMIINPGPETTVNSLIIFLKKNNITPFAILVSNLDKNRAESINTLLNTYKIKRFLYGETCIAYSNWPELKQNLKDKQIGGNEISKDDVIYLSKDTAIKILSPPEDFIDKKKFSSDTNSLVVKIEYGEVNFLYTSDINSETENYLIQSNSNIKCNTLITACSKRKSNSVEFLSLVKPCQIIVCPEYGGKLSKSAFERISKENSGADILNTDSDGNIELLSDGRSIISRSGGG
jgi:competence protein ComEC